MSSCINGSPSSFRHYRLTLQLVLSRCVSRDTLLDAYTPGVLFHESEVSIHPEFHAKRGDEDSERIDRGLFAENSHGIPEAATTSVLSLSKYVR